MFSHCLFPLKWKFKTLKICLYFYYTTAANTVQITVQIYTAIFVKLKTCLPHLCSRKPGCSTGWQAFAKLSHSPSFIDKFIDYSSWMINLLLDVLVCSVAVYFHSFVQIWIRTTRKNIRHWILHTNTSSEIYVFSGFPFQKYWGNTSFWSHFVFFAWITHHSLVSE